MKELNRHNIKAEVLTSAAWSALVTPKLIERVLERRPDIVHIQYPTQGYGAGLAPQLLSLAIPTVVTIHEVKRVHILRRLALYPFSLRAQRIIFTNDADYRYAIRYAPWVRVRGTRIPIASNIPTGKAVREREPEVVYFGLIEHRKGLEDFLQAAALALRRGLPLRFRIIGACPIGRESYLRELRRYAPVNVQWSLALKDTEVADLLQRAFASYLPFPDGVSERRGSVLATLGNGVPTITTKGEDTPEYMREAVVFASSPVDAVNILERLMRDETQRQILADSGARIASRFTWSEIARRHIQLYASLKSRGRYSDDSTLS